MNYFQNVKSWEQAQKLARKIGGTLICLNGTTAVIMGGDINKVAGENR